MATTNVPGMSQATAEHRHPLLRAIDQLAAALDSTTDLPTEYLTDNDRLEAITQLTHATQRAEGLRLELLAQAGPATHDLGYRDPAAWLGHTHHLDRTGTRRHQHTARQLADHPLLGQAVRNGHATLDQARVIADAVDALPDRLGPQIKTDATTHLIDLAAQHGPRPLRRLGRHILDVVAPDIADAELARRLAHEEAHAHATSRLTTRSLPGGMTRITAVVPDLTATLLTQTLEAISAPRRDHLSALDRRDPVTGRHLPHSQLLGQALTTLVENLDTTGLPHHGGTPVQVIVTIDLDTLLNDLGVATLSTGNEITADQARRLACQAQLAPAVLDTDSEVLDLGTRRRLFTPAQRRAAMLTQTHCQAQGCDIPAAWTEAHHATPWSRGGPTDQTNLILLCSRHHHLAHHPHWQTTRANDGTLTYHRRS